jgi:uncharacterized protein YukE
MASKHRELLSRFVSSYRRRLIAVRITRVGLIAVAILFAIVALLQIIFALFPWTVLPLVSDIVFIGACLFVLGYGAAASSFRAPGLLITARMIGQSSAVEKPLLSLAMELSGNECTRDNPFTASACGRAAAELGRYPRSPARPRSVVLAGIASLALGALCLLNHHLSPRLLDYWNLPFTHLSRLGGAVSPGSITVPMNASVTLRLVPAAARLPSCRCMLSSLEGERLSNPLLRPDPDGAFTYRVDSVRNSFVYRFAFGGALLRADTVTVAPLPRCARLSVTLRPPAYTRRSARTLPEGQGDFDAYAGSIAHIAIESERLSKACIVRGRDSLPCAVTGAAAAGEFRVDTPCSYTFALTDTFGQKGDSLPVFHVGCIPDEPPSVQIVKPGFNKDLQPEQVETLAVEGVDDIGIRRLSLKWHASGGQRSDTGGRDLSEAGTPPLIRAAFIWRLTELSLYPGDTVFYWAEITDTKPTGRPQQGFSDTFTFRIPTFEEIHRQVLDQASAAETAIGAVRGRQGELQDRLDHVVKAAAGRRELTWEQKQILRDVRQELEAQADSLRRSLQAVRENIDRMKQEGLAGEELAQKFDKVRSAVDQLVREYGDSLLFSMKDIDKPVSWRDLRQAVEKVNALLPRLGEELDNVLKFLEMLKQDRKLAELAMRAERLSKEQASLQAMLSRGGVSDRTATARQKELLDGIRKLSRDIAAWSDAGAAAPDSLMSKMTVDSLQSAMRSDMPPSSEAMNRMSAALLSLSQDLLQMMHSHEGMRRERERERLLSLSGGALSLAEWQDELMRDDRDPAAAALSQQALKDALGKSREAADSLSLLPPQDMAAIAKGFHGAMGASDEVVNALESGGGREAMAGSGAALRSLAGALLSALSNIDKEQQSSCSGGACMIPGLRRLSGRQAAINSMTADLLRRLLRGPEGEGRASGTGNGSAQGAEEARREAQKAQAAIADELRKLSEKYGREAGEGLRGRVGDLEEEARKLAAMLERPAPDITEHQDRFLARMLETSLSLHRRDEGKDEWKSRSAEKIFGAEQGARPGTFFKDADLFHRLRQKAYQGNFPEHYRAALRAYFDALSEKYLK